MIKAAETNQSSLLTAYLYFSSFCSFPLRDLVFQSFPCDLCAPERERETQPEDHYSSVHHTNTQLITSLLHHSLQHQHTPLTTLILHKHTSHFWLFLLISFLFSFFRKLPGCLVGDGVLRQPRGGGRRWIWPWMWTLSWYDTVTFSRLDQMRKQHL